MYLNYSILAISTYTHTIILDQLEKFSGIYIAPIEILQLKISKKMKKE